MDQDGGVEDIRSGSWRDGTVSAVILAGRHRKVVILMDGESAPSGYPWTWFSRVTRAVREDGTVQGLLELAKIPYVGCGVAFVRRFHG